MFCLVRLEDLNTDMFKGSYTVLRLMCNTKIAQYSSFRNFLRRSNSVCFGSNLVLIEKQKLLGNVCFQTQNVHTLKNINGAVICKGGKSGTLTFLREKYKKVT